jgi:lysozyme family protein
MQSNFDAALDVVLTYEGGYVDHPKDPGGATNLGITQAVLSEWRGKSVTKAQVKALTKKEAGQIYKARYWDKVRGDALPSGVDLTTMDGGVNSGPSRSVKWLQSALKVEADGVLGPKTLNAAQSSKYPDTIKAHCAKRLGFVKSLAIWNTFGKGWSRRIAHVEATALSWVLSKAQMEAEAKKAQDQATKQGGGAVIVTGGGVSDQAFNLSGIPWWAVAALVAALVAVLAIHTIISSQRAQALSKAAEGAKQ